MKKEMKKAMLGNVAEISKRVAMFGDGLPTLFGFYEPEVPKAVKDMNEKRKTDNKK